MTMPKQLSQLLKMEILSKMVNMENIIFTTDWHLDEKSMDEIEEIINEVYFSQDFKIDKAIIIGDLFNSRRPTPLEYEKMTNILCKMQQKMEVIIITGNHEELAKKISALDYCQYFGIKLFRNEAKLNLNGQRVLLGHYFVDETPDAYCKGKRSVKELEKDSDLVLLGHFHGFCKMGQYTYHLGSSRRQNFKEIEFGIPKYAIMQKSPKIAFKDIKSAIPMYEVDSVKKTANLPCRAKIRLVFNTFEQFKKECNLVSDLEKKFFEFKLKLNFKKLTETVDSTKETNIRTFDEIFNEFLYSEVDDTEVQNLIKTCLEN